MGARPLRALFLRSGEWPSNGDNVNFFLIADSNFVSNRTVERFNPGSMADTPPYNTRAPSGYFIIDAMDRGNSREQKFSELTNRHDPLQWRPSVNLPPDRTPVDRGLSPNMRVGLGTQGLMGTLSTEISSLLECLATYYSAK